MNHGNGNEDSTNRLPIPSSNSSGGLQNRRRASTNPAMLNLQRRFGLGGGGGNSNSGNSSNNGIQVNTNVVNEGDAYQYEYNSPSSPNYNNNNNNSTSDQTWNSPSSTNRRRRNSVATTSGNGWEQQQLTYENQYGNTTTTGEQKTNQSTSRPSAPKPTQRTRVSQLPHGWIQYWCPIEQTYYYYHPTTDHSTWEKPASVSSSELPGEAQFRRKRYV